MTYQKPPSTSDLIQTGKKISEAWSRWFLGLVAYFEAKTSGLGGFSGTIPLAKITVGGADGSITITNGIVKSRVAPT